MQKDRFEKCAKNDKNGKNHQNQNSDKKNYVLESSFLDFKIKPQTKIESTMSKSSVLDSKIRTTSGFVAVIGRSNAGKSSLLNALINCPLALVSKKINATRKRVDFIVPYKDCNVDSQIIFMDTPGIYHGTNLLNEFMQNESKKAILGSDICIFLAVTSKNQKQNQKELQYYKDFLKHNKKHILILNKIDLLNQNELLECMQSYNDFKDNFIALVPMSATNLMENKINELLKILAYNLQDSPHLYDNEFLSTANMKEFYKEAIREAIFERLSDELPYESDVIITKVQEKPSIIIIFADIIVEKESQKAMIIGKNANTIKDIGIKARKKCQMISNSKIFLNLCVKILKGWSKNKMNLKKIGYDFDA